MEKFSLTDMKGGWFVGAFSPTALSSSECEVACKHYKAGDHEAAHFHKIATEVTLIASGRVRMNGIEYVSGDIIRIAPGEATDFHALEATTTLVVKIPCVAGDKYLVGPA